MDSDKERSICLKDTLKIHAICADLSLSENDARLLTYIHAKGVESGCGTSYFDDPPQQDTEALEIMLGRSKGALRLPSIMNLGENSKKALDLILKISSEIHKIDNLLANELGMENRLSGELRTRLRLYRDDEFRKKMIAIYNESIVPLLSIYDENMIDNAFDRYRKEQQRIEKELIEMTGLKDV